MKLAGLDETYYYDKQGHRRRKLRVHSLRKYFCTKIILKNPDKHPFELMKATRHKSVDVFYNHYFEVQEKKTQKETICKAFG